MALKIAVIAIIFSIGFAQKLAKNAAAPNITGASPKLKLVATVDGKSFFADNEGKNWTQAASYCRDLGMKPASITSRSQFSALDDAYSSDFNWFYWTSGRDARTLTQFVWNETNSELLPSDLVYEDISWIAYQTCVIFETSVNKTAAVLYPYLCSDRNPGSLCET